jgi:hypothetical protein|tara:strand:+ start:152 stop:853 length:702 start_codon:yes stop_codon:yes gene_type:complete
MPSPFKQPWHFDKFKEDQEGEYVKRIGVLQGDWKADIELARSKVFQFQNYNEQRYDHAANKKSEGHVVEDSENPDGKPEATMFRKINYDKYPGEFPMFTKITDMLEFDTTQKLTCKFNDQFPNDQLMWHIDNLPGNPRKERVHTSEFKYQSPDKLRVLITLEDHEPGQVFQFGNIVYTQWKAGTIFAWEWSTLPHATWNGSWIKRPCLQITGTATNATWDIINNGSTKKEYKI